MVNTVITPLLLGATPQHLLGRVSAVINPVQQLASICRWQRPASLPARRCAVSTRLSRE
jgi:hypothetical protein